MKINERYAKIRKLPKDLFRVTPEIYCHLLESVFYSVIRLYAKRWRWWKTFLLIWSGQSAWSIINWLIRTSENTFKHSCTSKSKHLPYYMSKWDWLGQTVCVCSNTWRSESNTPPYLYYFNNKWDWLGQNVCVCSNTWRSESNTPPLQRANSFIILTTNGILLAKTYAFVLIHDVLKATHRLCKEQIPVLF